MKLWMALATLQMEKIPEDSRIYFVHPHVNASAGWSSRCYAKPAKHSGLFQRRARMLFYGVCNQDLDHDGKHGQLKARCHIFCFYSFIIPRLILILKGSSCYRTHFPILGVQICRTAWLKYLGIGKQRLQRTKKRFRGIDERTLAQQRPALCAISFYFVKLF